MHITSRDNCFAVGICSYNGGALELSMMLSSQIFRLALVPVITNTSGVTLTSVIITVLGFVLLAIFLLRK
jgi:hypothetical protein